MVFRDIWVVYWDENEDKIAHSWEHLSATETFRKEIDEINKKVLDRFDVAMQWVIETAEYNAKIQLQLYLFQNHKKINTLTDFFKILIDIKENKFWEHIEKELFTELLSTYTRLWWASNAWYNIDMWECKYQILINMSERKFDINKVSTTTIVEVVNSHHNQRWKWLKQEIEEFRNLDSDRYNMKKETSYLFWNIYWKIVNFRKTLTKSESEQAIRETLNVLLENPDIVKEMKSQWLIKNHDERYKIITLDGNAMNLIWKVDIEYGWVFKFAYYEGLKYKRYWEKSNRLVMD